MINWARLTRAEITGRFRWYVLCINILRQEALGGSPAEIILEAIGGVHQMCELQRKLLFRVLLP